LATTAEDPDSTSLDVAGPPASSSSYEQQLLRTPPKFVERKGRRGLIARPSKTQNLSSSSWPRREKASVHIHPHGPWRKHGRPFNPRPLSTYCLPPIACERAGLLSRKPLDDFGGGPVPDAGSKGIVELLAALARPATSGAPCPTSRVFAPFNTHAHTPRPNPAQPCLQLPGSLRFPAGVVSLASGVRDRQQNVAGLFSVGCWSRFSAGVSRPSLVTYLSIEASAFLSYCQLEPGSESPAKFSAGRSRGTSRQPVRVDASAFVSCHPGKKVL